LSWIAGVDYPLNPQKQINNQDFDEMHPNKIARIVPEIIQNLNQENVKNDPKETPIGQENPMENKDENIEVEIVFNKEEEDENEDHPEEPLFDQVIRT
jgi:hypothetical protein